jgi:NAD(P)H-binding
MGTTSFRDSILLVGASGQTGRYVLRYLCAASVPVIACVRSADRLASEPSLGSAEVVVANVEQPYTLAPLIERAAHVIYLAGGDRRGLSPGAWQLEIDSLSGCLELARRAGLPGRWISVGYSGSDQRTGATTWAETRWRELKLAADDVIAASGVNYFVLRTGLITAPTSTEPRVSITQDSAAAGAQLPCNALAFLLTGVALAGATNRSSATVRLDPNGLKLQSAVQAFARLRPDGPILSPTRMTLRA